MGDRVSISFKQGKEESVTLFSHWQGMGFVTEAKDYLAVLRQREQKGGGGPLDRMEPCTVMVDFIRHITKGKARVEGDLYLGHDPNDGDNSDNGHWTLDVDTGKANGQSRWLDSVRSAGGQHERQTRNP